MAEGALAARSGQRDVDDLLPLALSRPHEALARARVVLKGRPGPYEASVAHQAAGIVLRDFGDVNAGVRELRDALRLARRTGTAEREADVLGSLGGAYVYAGRTADGLAALNRAVQLSSGMLLGRVLHRRGLVLWTLGRYPAALDDFRRAVSVLRRAGDQLWTARALGGRGLVYLAIGSPARADADFVAAERLFAGTGQELEAVHTVVNRADAAFRSGDLPAALSLLDEAASRYRPLNVATPFLSLDRCDVLLAAGLASDALAEADAAIRDIEHTHGWPTKKAELLLAAANCALAAAQPRGALDRAQAAYRLFRSQQSAWWQAHAGLVLAQAQYAAGLASGRLLRQANRTAARLEALGSSEVAQAHLLAGRMALKLGRRDDADRHLVAAARSRRRGPAMSRANGWLSEALRAEAAGQPHRLFAACRRGLEVLDEHRYTLGASELRAQATAHGTELAAIAQRHAAGARRPRLLLAWTERWRATALTVPAVRPSADAELNTGLAALREVTSQLEQARSEGRPAVTLEREQRRLESAVRASALRARGTAGPGRAAVDIAELLDELGRARLIEIVDIDGTLHALTCGAGQVRQFTAGRTEDAVRVADFARFALRRVARSRPGDDLDSALAVLKAAGPKLQAALLGPASRNLGDGPVVIVPPGRLHAIPWALLPALADRMFSVAPSAGAWLRAHTAPPPRRRHVTLVRGPGLVTEGAEVPQVAPLYDDVMVLAGGEATTEQVLSAIDGSWLAHVAAHGTFRADSPLFSSLRMHDGLLSVYDFERLKRAPYRLVLSSCDSAVLAPAGADELLGLVSSLLPLGTAGIIASVVQLNDHAAVPMMVDLHRYLGAGQTLAEAMSSVRRGLSGDPLQQATAMSLVALGAG
ncbi:MAG TPA: CHAT domain-containing tetratricopeptide repeat protein [Streptosporangiaceae bacterium]|nr:CHAT domain-containing tetratricopeptide repeat protein [Streptosporangiaceae bacterium]